MAKWVEVEENWVRQNGGRVGVVLLRVASVHEVAVLRHVTTEREDLHFLPLSAFIDAKTNRSLCNGMDCGLLVGNHVTGGKENEDGVLCGFFGESFTMLRNASQEGKTSGFSRLVQGGAGFERRGLDMHQVCCE